MKLFTLSLLIFFSLSSSATPVQEGSPFTNIDFENNYVKVEHEGQFYYLISIDSVPTEDLLNACTAIYAGNCGQMLVESFKALLSSLSVAGTDWDQPGALDAVDLELYFFATHQVRTFRDVSVTAEKRAQLLQNLVN